MRDLLVALTTALLTLGCAVGPRADVPVGLVVLIENHSWDVARIRITCDPVGRIYTIHRPAMLATVVERIRGDCAAVRLTIIGEGRGNVTTTDEWRNVGGFCEVCYRISAQMAVLWVACPA